MFKKFDVSCKAFGIPFDFIEVEELSSDDFGYYTRLAPGTLFYIGAGEKQPELHTPEYDFPDSLLRIAPELLAAIAREPELAK